MRDVLEFEYSRTLLDRIECVVFDEEQLPAGVDGTVLGTTYPEEVESIEFLFRGAMLRTYTRDFIQEMIARDLELRAPTYFHPRAGSPPLCL